MLRTLLDPNMVVRQPPEASGQLSYVGNIIPLTRALHRRNLAAISDGHRRNIRILSEQHSRNLDAIASLHSRNIAAIAHMHGRNMSSLTGAPPLSATLMLLITYDLYMLEFADGIWFTVEYGEHTMSSQVLHCHSDTLQNLPSKRSEPESKTKGK